MLLSDIGEFGLIRRIAGLLPASRDDVVVGIGDDVAVLRTSASEYLLATCDIQIENVHFFRDNITPYQLGKKVVAINVSDIAAMGGAPAWALASLALPRDIEVTFVDELYRGMREQMAEAGASIVGGNLSKIREEILIDFFLLGKVVPDQMTLRSGARRGDLIFVTGTLGDSRAGLELIRRPELPVSGQGRGHVMKRHFTPRPRLREGQALARSGLVHAMADVSDGLVGDLSHICRASRVGAEIRLTGVPVSRECEEVAHAAGQDASDWALTGGEDYELLFTADSESASEIRIILENETGTACHAIGRIVDEAAGIGMVLVDGERVSFSSGSMSWDHFGGSSMSR